MWDCTLVPLNIRTGSGPGGVTERPGRTGTRVRGNRNGCAKRCGDAGFAGCVHCSDSMLHGRDDRSPQPWLAAESRCERYLRVEQRSIHLSVLPHWKETVKQRPRVRTQLAHVGVTHGEGWGLTKKSTEHLEQRAKSKEQRASGAESRRAEEQGAGVYPGRCARGFWG